MHYEVQHCEPISTGLAAYHKLGTISMSSAVSTFSYLLKEESINEEPLTSQF